MSTYEIISMGGWTFFDFVEMILFQGTSMEYYFSEKWGMDHCVMDIIW